MSNCITIDDVLGVDGQTANKQELLELFEEFKTSHPNATVRDWLVSGRSRRLRELISRITGVPVSELRIRSRRRSPDKLIDMSPTPKPDSITTVPNRETELLRMIERNRAIAWERLGRLLNRNGDSFKMLVETGRVGSGLLRILKGNLGEVFAMTKQYWVLAQVKYTTRYGRSYRNAKLFIGVRVRKIKSDGSLDNLVKFSDNIIAVQNSDGTLEVVAIFEVKSGYRGGVTGNAQVFRWVEDTLDDGVQLVFPRGTQVVDIPRPATSEGSIAISTTTINVDKTYLYNPRRRRGPNNSSLEEHLGSAIVTGLSPRSKKFVLTTRGESSIGLEPEFSSTPAANVYTEEFGLTHQEYDYLMRKMLENPRQLPNSPPARAPASAQRSRSSNHPAAVTSYA